MPEKKQFTLKFSQMEDGRWFCLAKEYDLENDLFDENGNNI